ncbi:hypothetical protein CJF30_00007718 [Rutstroemia sp. NJR-2017a BBW]|nr:hypothetical protein CJF30_00007718 [Rutstroemia sp. NJR-2017a BBW]
MALGIDWSKSFYCSLLILSDREVFFSPNDFFPNGIKRDPNHWLRKSHSVHNNSSFRCSCLYGRSYCITIFISVDQPWDLAMISCRDPDFSFTHTIHLPFFLPLHFFLFMVLSKNLEAV